MSGKSRQPILGGDDVSLFALPPVAAARALIGCLFEWDGCSGWIVEAEAYSEWNDEACHTHVRPSARRFVDEHPPGTAYVYLNYGVHWMTNVVVGDPVTGERGFVLLRALQPECGLAAMRERRGRQPATDLCSGPGKLSQALGIHGGVHGTVFSGTGCHGFLEIRPSNPAVAGLLVTGPRIGISKAVDLPWRFFLKGNAHVSGPRKGR